MPKLTDPIQLGAIHAPNRFVMAPLTRGRADRNAVPTPVMVDYTVSVLRPDSSSAKQPGSAGWASTGLMRPASGRTRRWRGGGR